MKSLASSTSPRGQNTRERNRIRRARRKSEVRKPSRALAVEVLSPHHNDSRNSLHLRRKESAWPGLSYTGIGALPLFKAPVYVRVRPGWPGLSYTVIGALPIFKAPVYDRSKTGALPATIAPSHAELSPGHPARSLPNIVHGVTCPVRCP
jgi:hypothetical protein